MAGSIQQLTLSDVYVRASRLYRNRPAVIEGNRTILFGELNEQANRLAHALRRLGITHGDRVAILSLNNLEYLVCIGAVAKLGAVLVPINFRLQPSEISFMLEDSEARLLLVQPSFLQAIEGIQDSLPALQHIVVFGEALAGTFAYADLLQNGRDEEATDPAVTEEDLIALMYTAAIDGRPRGAMMNHRSFVYQNVQMGLILGITSEDVYINLMPLFHTMDLSFALAALHHGASNVILSNFDGQTAAQMIELHHVTIIGEFAPMATRILEAASEKSVNLSSVRAIFGLDSRATVQNYLERFPTLTWYCGYGQTETHGLVASAPIRTVADLELRPGMPGRPAPMNPVRIVDENDQDVPPGEVGEIVVRGPNVAVGYWKLPEITAHVTRKGWHHTGDLGRLDVDGWLWFVDRKGEKDLIKTGGENVYPQEVERVVSQHPAVQQVCVIGIADPQWFEAVMAIVVLKPEATVTATELIEFCRQRMASYKKPRFVTMVESLPRTPAGALDRQAVKRLYSNDTAGA